MNTTGPRLPAGRPPHDPLNGMRVGALAGGIMGLLASWLVASPNIIALFAGAIAGGMVGYTTEKAKQRG